MFAPPLSGRLLKCLCGDPVSIPLCPQTDFEKDVDMACRSGTLLTSCLRLVITAAQKLRRRFFGPPLSFHGSRLLGLVGAEVRRVTLSPVIPSDCQPRGGPS